MTPPERLGELAAVFLARTWHQQGDPMPDEPGFEERAQRIHAHAVRAGKPEATVEDITRSWNHLSPAARNQYRRIAASDLPKETTP